MPTLYDIAAEYRALAAALEESGAECSPEIDQQLAALEGDLHDKARSIVGLIREYQTESDAIKAEADRLAALARSKSNAADRLKAYLLTHLSGLGVSKLDVGIAKLSVQRAARPSIRWDSAAEMPPAYTRTKVELDGTAAFAAYKAGQLPDGFAVEFTTFLSIR